MKIGLGRCAVVALSMVTLDALADMPTPYEAGSWGGAGFGGGDLGIAPYETDPMGAPVADTVDFGYYILEDDGGGAQEHLATFTHAASTSGEVTLYWSYCFHHAWFDVSSSLTFFADGPSGLQTENVVDFTQAEGTGSKAMTGMTTLTLSEGYDWGLTVGGSNYDSNEFLHGDVLVSLGTEPANSLEETWYRDLDGDGYGDPERSMVGCGNEPMPGFGRGSPDNCLDVYNPDQGDDDGDGIGNACDEDYTTPSPTETPDTPTLPEATPTPTAGATPTAPAGGTPTEPAGGTPTAAGGTPTATAGATPTDGAATQTPGGGGDEGCSCSHPAGASGSLSLLGLLLLARPWTRRRRSAAE